MHKNINRRKFLKTTNDLVCIDAKTGEIFYRQSMKSKYNASPVLAGGCVYFSSTSGKTLVIKEGKVLDIIAENELEGQIWASPAAINKQLLIRTSKDLYMVGEK